MGSGTLITFPTLLAMGVPAGARQRDELSGPGSRQHQRRLCIPRCPRPAGVALGRIVAAAAVCGALLVLVLPSAVFAAAVPWLILLAVVLVALQPLVVKHLPDPSARTGAVAMAGSGFWGYFGADGGSRSSLHCPRAGAVDPRGQRCEERTGWGGQFQCRTVFILGAGGVDGGGGAGGPSLFGGGIGGRVTRQMPALPPAQPGHRGRSDRGPALRSCVGEHASLRR